MVSWARRLPWWGKLVVVACVALCVGGLCYLANGAWLAVAGAGSGVLAWLGLRQRRDDHLHQAADLARRDRERQELDGATAVERAETAARAWLAERSIKAIADAHALTDDDGGDPNRVLDRHSTGPGTDSSDDD